MNKIISLLFISLLLIGFVSAHGEVDELYDDHHAHHDSMMGGYYNAGFGYGMGIFMWIFWLLIIVALILLVVWLVRQLQKPVRRKR